MSFIPKHVVITGASSGIGEALALHYAAGGVRLSLTGRNAERLEAVADACARRGAEICLAVIDVTDRALMAEWLEKIDNERAVDLVIANAGISGGTGVIYAQEDPRQVRSLFDVNVRGVFNTIDPLQGRMVARGFGHIAIMSSLAGFRGFPGAPAYSASKAAVKVYGEGLRGSLRRTGVQVHVILPGFVKSRMTDENDYAMPFLMPAAKAARIIAKGIARGCGRIAFPLPTLFFAWLLGALPDCAASFLLRDVPAKKSHE